MAGERSRFSRCFTVFLFFFFFVCVLLAYLFSVTPRESSFKVIVSAVSFSPRPTLPPAARRPPYISGGGTVFSLAASWPLGFYDSRGSWWSTTGTDSLIVSLVFCITSFFFFFPFFFSPRAGLL